MQHSHISAWGLHTPGPIVPSGSYNGPLLTKVLTLKRTGALLWLTMGHGPLFSYKDLPLF